MHDAHSTTQTSRPSIRGDTASPWHAMLLSEVHQALGGASAQGLSSADAHARLVQFGPNQLRTAPGKTIWQELLKEAREPMILLLITTGILYAVWGEPGDAVTIFGVIVALLLVEITNEQRAKRAIAALHTLAAPTALARRDGQVIELPAAAIVPGDVVFVQAGRRVPADSRLLETFGLTIDEAALTGESAPVEKRADLTLAAATPLGERLNILFAGTTVTHGRGTALVVGTGMDTEIGRITGLARRVKPPRTALQQAMRTLSRNLVGIALGFSVIVPLLGVVIARQPLEQMLLTGRSLAFATIPEELPIIITMVLALGAYRLARQHAIVKRLQSVEALGTITVLATDKTGTLTENRMVVQVVEPAQLRNRLLRLGVLASAAGGAADAAGDPLETALAKAARADGFDLHAIHTGLMLRDEFTFDITRKRMSAVYTTGNGCWIAAKGAPEAVLAITTRMATETGDVVLDDAARQHLLTTAMHLASNGLRVLALAERVGRETVQSQEEAERDMTFVGLVGFADPLRPDAAHAIADCQAAGIRPVMVTGDHPRTAQAIALRVGLGGNGQVVTGLELDALTDDALRTVVTQASIYARITPEHKLRIVQALQAGGERVAMTGDGVNDAPALVAADIGIAIGKSGTDVAREAADVVLADDSIATMVRATGEGRVLFANLQKGVRYYLACKVALILATLLPALLGVPVPFAPVQIILMELLMDLAASATFVAEPGERDIMRRPPRDPRRPFLDRDMVTSILVAGTGLFAAVSTAYLITWYSGVGLGVAQTVAFLTWLTGHVLLAFNLRAEREPLLRLGVFSNRLMVGWAAVTALFVVIAAWLPGAQSLLKTERISWQTWILVLSAAVLGTCWMEIGKLMRHRSEN